MPGLFLRDFLPFQRVHGASIGPFHVLQEMEEEFQMVDMGAIRSTSAICSKVTSFRSIRKGLGDVSIALAKANTM